MHDVSTVIQTFWFVLTPDSNQKKTKKYNLNEVKNGKPFVHAHAVLADKNGNTNAGHLLEGVVFAAEINLHELKGTKLERKYDKVTGLSLWKTEQ